MNCPIHRRQLRQSFRDYFFCRATGCGWWRRRDWPMRGMKRVRQGPVDMVREDLRVRMEGMVQ